MNGELAQLIWLAAHGTRFLRSGELPPDSSSVFQYVRAIRFDAPRRRRLRAPERADGPIAWLTQLRDAGVKHLGLDALGQLDRSDPGPLPDHFSVAFVGGLGASLAALGPQRAERWKAVWSVKSGDRPADNRIWYVEYSGNADERCRGLEHPTPDAALDSLLRSLESAKLFASTHRLSPWTEFFADALQLAEQELPDIPYHADLLPQDTDPLRRRTLAAASKAYVFGGMGSWNDMVFDGEAADEYASVTASLFQGVMTAVDAVANGFE